MGRHKHIPRSMTLSLSILLLFVLLLGAATAVAVDSPAPPTPEPTETHDGSQSRLDKLGEGTATTLYHEPLSRTIEGMSQKLDSFFGNEQRYEDFTASYGRLRVTSKYGRGGELTLIPKFQLRFKLPNLNRYLKFNLELDTEENDELQNRALESFDDQGRELPPPEPSSKFSSSVSPGLTYNTDENEFDPYAKIKFTYSFNLWGWASSLSQSFERYRSTGNGTRTNLTLISSIGDRYILTLTSKVYHNEVEYTHTDYQVTQGIKLAYQATRRWVISSEASIQGKTDPNWQHDLYTYNVRFRKNIHKGYVFMEIKPEIEFDSEENFHGSPSITLRLEIYYGAMYLDGKRL